MPRTLIPRSLIFGNPVRSRIGVSYDGEWLAWVAPLEGVMNLWVAPRNQPDAGRPITADTGRGIDNYGWSFDNEHLLYSRDKDGDENWHVYAVSIHSKYSRDLTPFEGAQCGVEVLSRHFPGEALISSNARDPSSADLLRIDIATGATIAVIENPGYAGFLCDDWFQPRLAINPTPSGGMDFLREQDGVWTPFMSFSADDARTSGPSHFDAEGRTLYYLDSRDRDTTALFALPWEGGEPTLIATDPRADVGGMINDNDSYRPLAYSVTVERHEYVVLDEKIRADIDFLDAARIGEWTITSRSMDDRWWTIAANSDVHPGRAWLYDRQEQSISLLYETRPELERHPLSRMHAVTIPSRDGLPLVCYVTIPADYMVEADAPRASKPLPMVLSVHGGPWMRDTFGFTGEHQWLADRGYAVMNVNFRGSSGFGKAFLSAGDGEWGNRMDDDLSDAVSWAIGQGIADPARIAIMGGSYGGYATLAAMTRHPEKYACGIDIFGPSNLETLLEAIPPYWEHERVKLYRAIGNPDDEAGRAMLRDRSPCHRAGDIRRPLLIGQGSNDPRVKQAESDQMVAAMEAKGIPVTYVIYPDEGHGFHRPPNNVSFNAMVEAFLAHHLGGEFETISTEEVEGATYELRGDVDWLKPLLPSRDEGRDEAEPAN